MWQISLGIAATAFFAGIGVTRTVYKAGQVDALKGQIETLQKQDVAKDELAEKYIDLNKQTREQMGDISQALVDLSLRQPKHTERVTETFRDAPTKYAEFDPNQCLRYAYPPGLRDELSAAIKSHAASLPYFDGSGRRAVRVAARENSDTGDNIELAGGLR